jgi:hypothetical protein
MKLTRPRLTVGLLMAAVAAFALLADRLRPLSQGEAVEVATRRFRQVPGASAWDHPKVRAYAADDGKGRIHWVVNFLDTADDRPIAQVSTDARGGILSAVVSLPGSAAPVPAESLTGPIPPPKR